MEQRHTFKPPADFTYNGCPVTEVTAKDPKLTIIYEGQSLVGGFGQLKFGFTEKADTPRVQAPFPEELVHPDEIPPQSDEDLDKNEKESQQVYDALEEMGIAVVTDSGSDGPAESE